MDSDRFDALTRLLSSRRAALTGLVGVAATLVGLAAVADVSAHNPTAACRRLPTPAKRRACRRRARRHNRTHRCRPRPATEICARLGRCSGVAVNNCRKRINCTCPAGKRCLSNGSCAAICGPGFPDCTGDCGCSGPEVGGGFICRPATVSQCEQVPEVCTTTADCPLGSFCFSQACVGSGGALENRCFPHCAA